MSATSLTEAGAAKQRRAMLEAPRSRLGLTRQALSSFVPATEAQLLKTDLPRSKVAEFVAGLSSDQTLSLRAKELDIDVKLLDAMDEYISILERHHGAWAVSDGRNVAFTRAVSEADVSRFNALGREMGKLAEEQRRLKAEVVELLKARSSSLPR